MTYPHPAQTPSDSTFLRPAKLAYHALQSTLKGLENALINPTDHQLHLHILPPTEPPAADDKSDYRNILKNIRRNLRMIGDHEAGNEQQDAFHHYYWMQLARTYAERCKITTQSMLESLKKSPVSLAYLDSRPPEMLEFIQNSMQQNYDFTIGLMQKLQQKQAELLTTPLMQQKLAVMEAIHSVNQANDAYFVAMASRTKLMADVDVTNGASAKIAMHRFAEDNRRQEQDIYEFEARLCAIQSEDELRQFFSRTVQHALNNRLQDCESTRWHTKNHVEEHKDACVDSVYWPAYRKHMETLQSRVERAKETLSKAQSKILHRSLPAQQHSR